MCCLRTHAHAKIQMMILALLLALTYGLAQAASGAPQSPAASEAARRRAVQMLQSGPAVFIENQGQWEDETVRFALSSMGANVGLTSQALRFQLIKREAVTGPQNATPARLQSRALPGRRDAPSSFTMRLHEFRAAFAGANPTQPVGMSKSSQTFNFRRGDKARWREGVPTWEAVRYPGLYKGIDLQVMGRKGGIKYEFHVAPGADWKQIALHYENIGGLKLREDGALELTPKAGWAPLVDGAPVLYQEAAGEKKSVAGRFRLIDPQTVGFEVTGAYDSTKPLVIDPDLAWGTYLGGSDGDSANAVATDAVGNVYVTGATTSGGWVSGTVNPPDYLGGMSDAYVVKMEATGAHLWSTYLGGANTDSGNAIGVDASGNVYVAGITDSDGWVAGGLNTTLSGNNDIFVARLTPNGQTIWSTYLGGTSDDGARCLAVDDAGTVYVAGYTWSTGWTAGGFKTNGGGTKEGFVAALSANCEHLWSTYVGGVQTDSCEGIAIDADNVYVTGTTNTAGWTKIGYGLTLHSGGSDAFALKMGIMDGSHVWSTYIGGVGADAGHAITVDGSGNVYVAGETAASGWVSGGPDTSFNGGIDAFVVKISAGGTHQWSTYLGGSGNDYGYGIAMKGTKTLFVSGHTNSPGWTSGGFDTTYKGGYDAFLAKLSTAGAMQWSTDLGSAGNDTNTALAADRGNGLLLAGNTDGAGWLTGGYKTLYGDSGDGFVVKVRDSAMLQVTITPPEAAAGGAKWRRTGTTQWLNSGDIEQNLNGGTVGVEFSAIPYWKQPDVQWVTIYDGDITNATGDYTRLTGSLRVTLAPPSAVSAGAKWRRVGTTTWLDSDFVETDAPAGVNTIEFKPVSGLSSPVAQDVTVDVETQTDLTATYTTSRSSLSWGTYLGGSGTDEGRGITLDAQGNVYVTGFTSSSGWVSSGYDTSYGGLSDAFVTRLSSTGSLAWSTYLGGAGNDAGSDIALDSAGNVLITGITGSPGWVSGGGSTTLNGASDAFAAKLSSSGQHLWSTYLGGSDDDAGYGIAVDPANSVYVTGRTNSAGWATGAYGTTYNGGPFDAFVARLTSGGQLSWSTYLGGSGDDQGIDIAVDPKTGLIYGTGSTTSAGWLTGGFNSTYHGGRDGFAIMLGTDGQPVWGNFIGGAQDEMGTGIAVDAQGNAYVAGSIASIASVWGSFDNSYNGGLSDGFVMKLTSAGKHDWSTYLGGTVDDAASGITLDGSGNVCVTGSTTSNYWTGSGFGSLYNGGAADAFVARLTPDGSHLWSTYLGSSGEDRGYAIAADSTGNVYVAGSTYQGSWLSGGYDTSFNGGVDAFVAKVRGVGSLCVTLGPQEACDAGARWRRVGTTTWLASGAVENNLPSGAYTLEFNTVAQFTSPANTAVNVVADQANTALATYIRLGSLRVTINPPQAVAAGAQWRRVGTTPWLNSGDTEYNVMPQAQVVEFKNLADWASPSNLTVVVPEGALGQGSASYTHYTGALTVTLSPPAAVAGGAQWRRAGTTPWLDSGATEGNVPTGNHVLEFKAIPDYMSPQNTTVTVSRDLTANAAATYVYQSGLLQVTITPPEAVAAGAQWRRAGTTPWMNSGAIESAIPVGNYDVEFKPIANWTPPANQPVAISNNLTAAVAGNYLPHMGAIQVTITPPEAAAAGAQWRRTGTTTWHNSGETEAGLLVGNYTVEFKPLTYWKTPANQLLTVNHDQTATLNGDYGPLGDLKVTITPTAAVTAGAQWRRVGTTPWLSSGATEANVAAGNADVEFKALAGWNKPTNQAVMITQGAVASTSGTYVQQLGSLAVTITPPQAVAGGAQWRRTGTTAWLDSGTTETNIPSGPCSVEFKAVDGLLTPATRAITINDQQTTKLSVFYDLIQTGVAWSTYVGGDSYEWGCNGIALDSGRNVLVTGMTMSTGWVSGGSTTTLNGSMDAFVVKISPAGQHVWSTYVGGSGLDLPNDIATDSAGNVYVTGTTDSDGWAKGGVDTTFNGEYDAFLVKLTPAGQLAWSTYLGGSGDETGYGVTLDGAGNIYVTGYTTSPGWLPGGYDTTQNGDYDGFVTKLAPTGQMLWGSYLGGSGEDVGIRVAVDGGGNIFVGGVTKSANWVSGGYNTTFATQSSTSYDGFLVKLSPTGQHLWSTYLGGSNYDVVNGLALDGAGNPLITGYTATARWVSGGYDTILEGTGDGFVVKISSAGQHLWSTYFGGSGDDNGNAITLDGTGNIYVTGSTNSADWMSGGFDIRPKGGNDACVVKLSPAGQYLWSGYLGGGSSDYGKAIAIDSTGGIVVFGETYSTGWVKGGYDMVIGKYGDEDCFVARIASTWPTQTGTLQVTLNPPAAVAAGAQWRRAGTTPWLNSGASEANIPAGYHNLEFKTVPGWVTPASQKVAVSADQLSTATATYPMAGLLRVTLTPPEAVSGGAQWRRTGTTTWLDSGATENNISTGTQTVEFKHVDGWMTPASQSVKITAGQTTTTTAAYVSAQADLSWSTYLGAGERYNYLDSEGAMLVTGPSVAMDSAGNILVCGTASSGDWVSGGYDTTFNGGSDDVCVIKLSPTGQHLWSTFMGGSSSDYGFGVGVDGSDNIYVTGMTYSSGWVSGGYNLSRWGTNDGFVVKLSPAGQHLWSTYIGGDNVDECYAIVVDKSGYSYVTGVTSSDSWTSGGWRTYFNYTTYSWDGFAVKLSPTGQHVWSTYLGGTSSDAGCGIAVDGSGNVYVTGDTFSSGWVYGGYNTTAGGYGDAFVVKLSSAGQHRWSTFLGGSYLDCGLGIAVDGSGNAYVTGRTGSSGWISGGYDTTPNGGVDGYVVKLSSLGQHLWSTYLGGSATDSGYAIATDNTGNICVTGVTSSSGWVSGGPKTTQGSSDAFVVRLNPSGQHLWSTFLGGSGTEGAYGVAMDSLLNIVVSGWTSSSSGWVSGGYDTTWNGGSQNAFVAKLHPFGSLTVTISPAGAITAGAQWRRVGTTTWLNSGATDSKAWTGSNAIEFKPIAGWSTPANWNGSLTEGQTVAVNGTYIRDTGTLTVTITPPAAVAAGAQWRRVGTTTWLASGATEPSIPDGTVTVEFKPVSGWTPPANTTVTVLPGQTASAAGAYVRQTGSLQMTLSPGAAVTAGAQWRRLGTAAWFASGSTESGIPTGAYTVEFKAITNYTAPANQTVTVNSNATATGTATYVRDTGSLKVTITPAQAVTDGAQWRRVGTTTWRASGSTETGIPTGSIAVEFKTGASWVKPANVNVTITKGQVAQLSRTILRLAAVPREAWTMYP